MGRGHGKHQGYGEVDQGKCGVKVVEGGGLHLLNVVPGNGVPVFEHVLSAGNVWRASVDGVHPAAFPAVFEFRQAADSAHVEPVLAALRANRKAGGAQGIVGGSALLDGGVGDTDTVTVLEAAELAVVPWELPLLLELLLEELALLPELLEVPFSFSVLLLWLPDALLLSSWALPSWVALSDWPSCGASLP